jgi:hypothetical protein
LPSKYAPLSVPHGAKKKVATKPGGMDAARFSSLPIFIFFLFYLNHLQEKYLI